MRRRSRPLAAIAAVCALAIIVSACGAASPWMIETQEQDASLLSITAADSTHAWAVGGGPIYFFNGVSWETQVKSLEAEPVSVSAADPSHLWACGGDGKGIIWSSDGKNWTKQLETADASMSLVSAADPSHVWAVGSNPASSTIYFFNGSSWASQYSGPFHAQDIFALDAKHVWAVAEDKSERSSVYFFDGASWSKQYEAPAGRFLFGISAADPDHAWAVGSRSGKGAGPLESLGSTFFFNGRGWAETQQTDEELHKVAAADAKHVWAVGGLGDHGPVYFNDGKGWSKQFDAHEALFDVAAADARHAWAVGGLGAIFVFEDTPF